MYRFASLALIPLLFACTEQDTPDWALEAEEAVLASCDEVAAIDAPMIDGSLWWNDSLGLTFEGVSASGFRACWRYEQGEDGEGHAILALEASRWELQPGAETTVRVDALSVINEHADEQPGQNGEHLVFELDDQEVTTFGADWSYYGSD